MESEMTDQEETNWKEVGIDTLLWEKKTCQETVLDIQMGHHLVTQVLNNLILIK